MKTENLKRSAMSQMEKATQANAATSAMLQELVDDLGLPKHKLRGLWQQRVIIEFLIFGAGLSTGSFFAKKKFLYFLRKPLDKSGWSCYNINTDQLASKWSV